MTRADAVCEGSESLSFIFSNVVNAQNLSSVNPVILDGAASPAVALAEVNLTAESFDPPNRFIDPGERVTVTLTPRVECEGRATNLIVALRPNEGVTAPTGPVTVTLTPMSAAGFGRV